jgi:hypothetical protein
MFMQVADAQKKCRMTNAIIKLHERIAFLEVHTREQGAALSALLSMMTNCPDAPEAPTGTETAPPAQLLTEDLSGEAPEPLPPNCIPFNTEAVPKPKD